jgi:hypothetical protein
MLSFLENITCSHEVPFRRALVICCKFQRFDQFPQPRCTSRPRRLGVGFDNESSNSLWIPQGGLIKLFLYCVQITVSLEEY